MNSASRHSQAQAGLVRWLCGLLLLTALGGPALAAQRLQGRVVKVSDGDTLTLLDADFNQHRIRLAWIDAPERQQAFGRRAQQMLARICAGAPAEARLHTRDRYGRWVAEVECLGVPANEAMVGSGLAWVYPDYTPVRHPLWTVERAARGLGVGLWSDPAPQAPWDWRRERRRATR